MTAGANTRKALERARKRALGLVRLELWLHPVLHARVRAWAERQARKLAKTHSPDAGQ